MFIAMNHLLFGGVITLLLIAFAFSMGREMLRNKVEEMENHVKTYATQWIEQQKQIVLLSRYKNAVLTALEETELPGEEKPEGAVALLIYRSMGRALTEESSPTLVKLLNKAKRSHGKKIRASTERKLKKVMKLHDEQLNDLSVMLQSSQDCLDHWCTQAAKARSELSMYQGAVMDILESMIKLPAVRRKFYVTLNARHREIIKAQE